MTPISRRTVRAVSRLDGSSRILALANGDSEHFRNLWTAFREMAYAWEDVCLDLKTHPDRDDTFTVKKDRGLRV